MHCRRQLQLLRCEPAYPYSTISHLLLGVYPTPSRLHHMLTEVSHFLSANPRRKQNMAAYAFDAPSSAGVVKDTTGAERVLRELLFSYRGSTSRTDSEVGHTSNFRFHLHKPVGRLTQGSESDRRHPPPPPEDPAVARVWGLSINNVLSRHPVSDEPCHELSTALTFLPTTI